MKYVLRGLVTTFLFFVSCTAFAVTLEEAEANPKNSELNRQFAIERFAENDLDVALAAIERVIIGKPTDISARFFRAKILVLLNRGNEVKEELELITTLKLPQKDIKAAEKLLADIEKWNRKFNGTRTVLFGFGYTDNANNWSDTGKANPTVALASLYDENKKYSDMFANVTFVLNGQYALDQYKQYNVDFSGGVTAKSLAETVEQESKIAFAKLGLSWSSPSLLRVYTSYGKTKLDRVNRYKDTNVNSDISITALEIGVKQKLSGGKSFGYSYSDTFNDHSAIDTAYKSDATAKKHKVDFSAPLSKSLFFAGNVSTTTNRADLRTEAAKKSSDKDTTAYSASIFRILEGGDTLILGFSASNTDFLTQVVTSGAKRADTNATYKLGYRMSADKVLPKLDGWKFGVEYKHSDSSSNLEAAELTSNTLSFTLSSSSDL